MTEDRSALERLPFRKYEALGNDYIVIDAQACPRPPMPAMVRALCDRRYGIGSDGVLYGPLVEEAGLRLRIFNPDGSEAEKSGNGIRIFARYLRDAGYVTEASGRIVTEGGATVFTYLDPLAHRIAVDMGVVTFRSGQIPVAGPDREIVDEVLAIDDRALRITCVSIGNPHCVVRQDGASEADARRLGPLIETHAMFPNRTNVQFMEVVDRRHIRIKIWERGAGYTLASGSSSCAAASAARRLGLVDDRVDVEMPGGVVAIAIGADRHVTMTGDVRSTIEGTISSDLAAVLAARTEQSD